MLQGVHARAESNQLYLACVYEEVRCAGTAYVLLSSMYATATVSLNKNFLNHNVQAVKVQMSWLLTCLCKQSLAWAAASSV